MTNKLHAGTWLLALAACAVLAGGTVAQAEIIHFTNPAHGESGHFHWASAIPTTTYMDTTQEASVQPAGVENGPSSFGHAYSDANNMGFTTASAGVAEFAVDGSLLDPFAIGEAIDSGATYAGFAFACTGGNSLLPEGVPTYLGVRFNGPNWQYGWIGVERTGLELEAFAWGYETEVGVPIAAGVPEPGTLAMLAVGAVGVLRRRR